jgi:hypothetical protein
MKHLILASVVVSLAVASASAQEKIQQLYAPMPADEVRSKVLDWAAAHLGDDRAKIEELGKLWAIGSDPVPADQLLDLAIQSFAMINADARKLIDSCHFGRLTAPELDLLASNELDPFFSHNIRMYAARFMAQARMYDDALDAFTLIDEKQVIDPPSLFFYRAVSEHALLLKSEGLKTLGTLLKNTSEVPVRYQTVAELMQRDLQALKERSLGEVARMMSDAERRLGLGEGGVRVQKVEEEIIARLDEIIKKMEEQQGGGGGGDGQNNSNQSSSPANDSRVKGATGRGEVDDKNIGKKSGWGALPPSDRAKAKSIINDDLPPHYRAAIQGYLKKSADRLKKTNKR